MKIIKNIYIHNEKGFVIEVITCNKRIATTEVIATGEIIKFNRGKFEWMIRKGVFAEVKPVEPMFMNEKTGSVGVESDWDSLDGLTQVYYDKKEEAWKEDGF